MNNELGMNAKDFLNYIKRTKSKATVKLYKRGLAIFCEYYGKTLDEILEERRQDWISGNLMQKKRFSREIEKFHKWMLDKGYLLNSASSFCNGILQFLRFFEMPVMMPTGTDVGKMVVSTKDFVPTIQQYRDMFKVAGDLQSKLILSMGLDLGWRIGDFLNQRKDGLPNLDAETPIAYDCITEKENVVAKSFLSNETVDLLKRYLPTLPKDNPYLFPSGNGRKNSHISDDTVNRGLRSLAEKAKIRIPKRKRLRFHAFRKRFLTTCADQGIDINTAKILVGKDVEHSMLTYLSEVEHRSAFIRVKDVLRLTELPQRKIGKDTTALEKEVEDLKRLVHGIVALGGRELVEKAKKVTGIDAFLRYDQLLDAIKLAGEKERKKQLEEYRKLIEADNNNSAT